MGLERVLVARLVVVGAAAALLGGCAHRSEVAVGSIKDGPAVAAPAPRKKAVAGAVYRHPVPKSSTVRAAAGSKTAKVVADAPAKAPAAAAKTAEATEASPVTKAAAIQPVAPAAVEPEPKLAGAPAERTKRTRTEQDARTVSLQLLAEGQRLFALGKVIEARKRYFAAMDGPVPEVLLALARSFDVHYLGRLQQPDAAPDMTRAVALYERAVERGSKDASADMARIKAATNQPAQPAGAPHSAQPDTPPKQ